ncbi:MAG: purine-nucleoside phosphorylase [Bacteroidales bacterium]|nr:purine-nucleoside phosphorylase [Bacteroidales bacterium]
MYDHILEAASYIGTKITIKPTIGIILGSGLGSLSQSIEVERAIPYGEIPYFPLSTVKGHKGQLVCGTLSNKAVVAMQGRFHYYEGYTMEEVTFAVRVMKALGVTTLLVTNAAGGINPAFEEGDIMLIKDHINLMPNPLIGKNDDRLGERFPAISKVYDKGLRTLAQEVARQNGITVKEGVYLGLTGPSFETDAEYAFFRLAGADCVGMSTVPEVIVAAHAGLKVFAMSVISNVFKPNHQTESSHEEVLAAVAKSSLSMEILVKAFLSSL